MPKRSGRLERLLEGISVTKERRPRSGRPVAFFLIAGIVIGFALVYGYELAGHPRFCGSCHSMEDRSREWSASRHKQFGCVECHMPVSNVVTRVSYKAVAGVRDLFHETMRNYGAHRRLSAESVAITDANCLRCHRSTVEGTALARGGEPCIKCHRNLVHGRYGLKGGITVEEKN